MTPKELGKPINTPAQLDRVRFSPDGAILAAGGSDGLVYRWDVTGKEPVSLSPLKFHDGWVTSLTFQGAELITADTWGKLACWDLSAKDPKPRWSCQAHDGWIRAVAIMGDTIVTCGRDQFVRWWKEDKQVRELQRKSDLMCLAVSPDSKTLAIGDQFGTIHVVNDQTSEIKLPEFHLLDRIQDVGGIRGLLFTPDGKTLIAAGAQPKTGGFVTAFPLIVALEWPSGKKTSHWKGPTENEGYFHDIVWHPDGFVMGVTSGQPGQGRLQFWKPGDDKPNFTYTKLANCHSLDRSSKGKLVLSGTNANSSGNGRPKGAEYPANFSPLQFFEC